MYTTNSIESTQYVIEKSGSIIVVVDDIIQLEKIRQIRKKLPNLKVILLKSCKISADELDDCYRWEDLEKMETFDVESEYNQRLSQLYANDCCLYSLAEQREIQRYYINITHCILYCQFCLGF